MPSSPSAVRTPCFTMIQTDSASRLAEGEDTHRFEVRSVTGARYTLVEECAPEPDGRVHRRYRTAYAGLPVVANDDGSFTIVDTHTRLVRVTSRGRATLR